MQPPQKKTGDAAAFISNCVAQSFRLEAVKQLSQAVAVHSFGACLNNIEGGAASKGDILPAYHFTLAFENSQVRDPIVSFPKLNRPLCHLLVLHDVTNCCQQGVPWAGDELAP